MRACPQGARAGRGFAGKPAAAELLGAPIVVEGLRPIEQDNHRRGSFRMRSMALRHVLARDDAFGAA